MARPVTVLINKAGGSASNDPAIASKIRAALRRAGVTYKLEMIEGDKYAARCRALAKRGDRLIIVGGGDGTIGAAASAVAGSKTALGLLPLGTLNHFARDLGIPFELDEAAKVIAAGKPLSVDVGEMNGHVFINNSAIGLYPLMVVDRDLQRKRLGRSKRLAMIIASLRTLARFNHQRLALTVNEERQARLDTPLLFVGNNNYRIDIGAPGRRESVQGGQLSAFVMRKKTRRGLIAASLRALFGRVRADDMVRIEHVERLRVASHRSQLAVSLDGEVVRARPPLDYRIRKRALRILAP